ncbi:MAG TPA: type II toxin-antitoxin system VapC family toxin [Afifellaceae bacterium]|nr:type II toxin-antitoxin system VapC family toxin [Afifellaceae bacterium]
MILLDTNVLSEIMEENGGRVVVDWLNAQPTESVWTSSITVLEIRFGIERLVPSRRREQLEVALATALDGVLGGRVVPFDRPAAERAAALAAQREKIGRPIEVRDIQIAGIAAARKAMLATRNTRHFDGLGIPLVNPWPQ